MSTIKTISFRSNNPLGFIYPPEDKCLFFLPFYEKLDFSKAIFKLNYHNVFPLQMSYKINRESEEVKRI